MFELQNSQIFQVKKEFFNKREAEIEEIKDNLMIKQKEIESIDSQIKISSMRRDELYKIYEDYLFAEESDVNKLNVLEKEICSIPINDIKMKLVQLEEMKVESSESRL